MRTIGECGPVNGVRLRRRVRQRLRLCHIGAVEFLGNHPWIDYSAVSAGSSMILFSLFTVSYTAT
jgi:hypothetical protein